MGKSGSIYFEYFYVVNKMSKTLVLLAGNGVKEYGLVFAHLILNHSKLTIVICDKHYVNVCVLMKFSQKTSVFTLIIISSP